MTMKCLYCYEELAKGEKDFHSACSKKFFGTETPPELPYNRLQINELAEQIIRSQTTLTGVQPKLSLDLDRKNAQNRLTIVGLWGKFILKPQTSEYKQLPENESLTMKMAKLVKIKTVPHSLIRFADGEICYITKRIDRDQKGGKLPMEDFCQLTERLTEHKYKGSYEQIAKHILKFSSSPKLDLANFWELVIFSFLTGNADMHLKNFSLYAPQNTDYQLVPAYDLLSTALVMPADKEDLALTLNGKKSKITRADFEKIAENSGLERKVLENIFTKFGTAVPQWNTLIDNSFLDAQMRERYKEIVNEKCEKINLSEL